ncbi:copper resistance protein B [Pseudomonas fluorescens]|nr:copper resistance protein B [Pseudomonas fluorescens]MBY9025783.1 copper resistance protein B [Pseudomonas fluorescens]MBY9032361.1 copper resistance protein B [Pseudomonas fluorescens]MBY9037601.1 copper resistance protein B [Pseudomonas fluorescens]MBY9043985.1 copper resistance protein B [Pseudomonas fluorescens]MBY9049280.1 copper resistance protein B [Pseudomonas fluorescens]
MTRFAAFSLSLLSMAPAFAASDMQGMDHSRMADMQGMDHSQMTDMQSMDDGMMQPAAPTESRTPIPALTDADRAAVFTSHAGHQVHDSAINTYFLADKLEWQDADDASTLAWDLSGWIGGDIDRLWLRSEGERSNGKTEDAEIQALWGHAISPWWDVVSGVRQDFKPGAPQTWAAFGLQGMALYNFEAEATAFLGENGQSAVRLEGDYDILLTNRLILQPTAELNVYGKNDPQRGIGSGLSNTEAGLRLRYEIRREFAPYIGVTWNRTYGRTADYAREEGEDRSEARLVLGVRLWF